VTIEQLAALLPKSFGDVYRIGDRTFICANAYYGNGDSVNLYLESVEGTQYVSDMGTTAYVVNQRTRGHGTDFDGGTLRIPVTPQTALAITRAFVRLCKWVELEATLHLRPDPFTPAASAPSSP
jgi:hypothetical protein